MSSKSTQVAIALDVLVGAVDVGDGRRVVGRLTTGAACRSGVVVGDRLRDLRPFDLGGKVTDLQPRRRDAATAGRLGDEWRLRLDDARHSSADNARPEVRKLPPRCGVKRQRLHTVDAERAQPTAHLSCGPRGEGDGEGVLWRHHPDAGRVGDAGGDGPRLARAGAGEDTDGPVHGRRHLALLRVEQVEDLLRSRLPQQGGRGQHACHLGTRR